MTNPTLRWGDRQTITLGSIEREGRQLLHVALPHPATCSIFFHADVMDPLALGGAVNRTTLELIVGVGTTTVTIIRDFPFAPQLLMPLDVWLDEQPLQSLQARVRSDGSAPGLLVTYILQLAPLSMIRMGPRQPLKFGMALPGEADSGEAGPDALELAADDDDEPSALELAELRRRARIAARRRGGR